LNILFEIFKEIGGNSSKDSKNTNEENEYQEKINYYIVKN
jgi:hypothetical protein